MMSLLRSISGRKMDSPVKYLGLLIIGIVVCLSGVSSGQAASEDSRFQINGDGTVLDSETGLMWASQDNGQDINWDDAQAYSEAFNGGGFNDWRLPTQRELITIFNSASTEKFKIFAPFSLTACCPWTSNTRRSQAKSIFFMMGERNWYSKSVSAGFRALPVRKK
jgi:hypothetical protein